ncbi:MAG: DUF4302 domain-containing protein [Bacteroidaceae bacterium]|jgi:hypothetical protein|nr:DUF4302 domain-containing protein [Bacteroidaceae bacterium]
MMKKNIRYISVALAAIAFAGCSHFQEEDLFEESAALRIEHNAEKLQQILVNAPQGWVIQYYTGRGVSVFEGFNLFAKFERDGKVTMAGNHRFLRDGNAGKYTEASSLYELIREDGLVLAFNTWNEVLTPFVDPVAPWAAPKDLLKDGAGMQGDQNLVIKSMKEDEVICRGERYDALIRLVKADRDWKTYIEDTEKMKSRITNSVINSYYITCGKDTMYYVGLKNGRYRISERVTNPLKVDSVSCCFTPTGFRNERVDTIGGHLFQEFKLNEDGSALVNEDGSVQVVATWDTYIVNARANTWNFDQDKLSDEQKGLLEQINAELKKFNNNYSLAQIGLGRSTGNGAVKGLVVTFYTNAAKTKTNTAGLSLTTTSPAYGQIQILYSADEKTDKNLANISSKSDVENLVRLFAATLTGTYNIVPDNYFLPTGCELHAVEGDNEYILK